MIEMGRQDSTAEGKTQPARRRKTFWKLLCLEKMGWGLSCVVDVAYGNAGVWRKRTIIIPGLGHKFFLVLLGYQGSMIA